MLIAKIVPKIASLCCISAEQCHKVSVKFVRAVKNALSYLAENYAKPIYEFCCCIKKAKELPQKLNDLNKKVQNTVFIDYLSDESTTQEKIVVHAIYKEALLLDLQKELALATEDKKLSIQQKIKAIKRSKPSEAEALWKAKNCREDFVKFKGISKHTELTFKQAEESAQTFIKDISGYLAIVKPNLKGIKTLSDLATHLAVSHTDALQQLNIWIVEASYTSAKKQLSALHKKFMINENLYPLVDQQLSLEEKLTQLGFKPFVPTPMEAENIAETQDLLNKLAADPTVLNKPLHLAKLQNLYNRLSGHTALQTQCEQLMESTVKAMSLSRKKALANLLKGWEDAPQVRKAFESIYTVKKQETDPTAPSRLATEKEKITFVRNKSKELADKLSSHITHIENNELKTKEWINIIKCIPEDFKITFFCMLGQTPIDNSGKTLKEYLIDVILEKVSQQNPLLTQEKRDSIKKDILNTSYIDITFTDTPTEQCYLDINYVITIHGYPWIVDMGSAIQQALGTADPIISKLEVSELKDLKEPCISILKIIHNKLNNVANRQDERLLKISNHEPAFLPTYFHTTPSQDALVSIAGTGIESVISTSGGGAFFSPEPLFRYGYVGFGMPKDIEISSVINTILEHHNAPAHVKQGEPWIGLQELIAIHSDYNEIFENIATRLESIVDAAIASTPNYERLSAQERLAIEYELKTNIVRSIVLRSAKNVQGHSIIELNYRDLAYHLPTGSVKDLKTSNDRKEFFDKLTPAMSANIRSNLINEMKIAFEKEFDPQKPLAISSTKRLKAVIIAPDDDMKSVYSLMYAAMGKWQHKEFHTISEIHQHCTNNGIEAEFVPWGEQVMEVSFTKEMGVSHPKK